MTHVAFLCNDTLCHRPSVCPLIDPTNSSLLLSGRDVPDAHFLSVCEKGKTVTELSECSFLLSVPQMHRLPKIKEWIDANDPGGVLIPFSGVLETRLSDMPDDERQRFLDENKITR